MAKKQKPKLATTKRYRDDVTGRFVTKKYAKKNRKTTTVTRTKRVAVQPQPAR